MTESQEPKHVVVAKKTLLRNIDEFIVNGNVDVELDDITALWWSLKNGLSITALVVYQISTSAIFVVTHDVRKDEVMVTHFGVENVYDFKKAE